jgi:hypothetical protein
MNWGLQRLPVAEQWDIIWSRGELPLVSGMGREDVQRAANCCKLSLVHITETCNA